MEQVEQSVAAGTITVGTQRGRTVVALAGEVDAALRDEASTSMGLALTSGLPVVVDSAQATFIDSAGLAFVLQLHLAAGEAGIPVTLHDPGRVVRDVLDLVGLSGDLRSEPAVP